MTLLHLPTWLFHRLARAAHLDDAQAEIARQVATSHLLRPG